MNFCKRSFLNASVSLLVLAAMQPGLALAQGDFPSKPIRVVVGYPPGQTVDGIARAATVALGQALGTTLFVDNKAGANGIIGAQDVKQAKPDGYTLLFGTSGQLAINPSLYAKLPYDPMKDLAPVALVATVPLYLVVPKASPFNSLGELVRYAKANPGKLSYGSGGRGITANLAMEMLKKAAGIDILHVPYKGSAPALTDLIGGQIDVMMDAGGLMLPQIEQGKLKALGVSSKARVAALPSLPTLAEQGHPGFEATAWVAAMAPANTPKAVVDKLNQALVAGQQHPDMIRAIRVAGATVASGTPEEFRSFLMAETLKWGRAAKDAGVEPE